MGFVECSSMRAEESVDCERILAASFEGPGPHGLSRRDDADVVVVREDGIVRGLALVRDRRAALGGEFVRAACLASVCVDPAHRSRGLAGALLDGLLHAAKRRGVGLALLTAQDERLYARHGFARGGQRFTCEFELRRGATVPDLDRVRPFDPVDRAGWLALLERASRERTAFVLPTELDRARRSRAPRRIHVCERAGEIVASITWSRRLDQGVSTLYVHELIASDRRAADSAWAFVSSFASDVQRVKWRAAPDDPLASYAKARGARFERRGTWMARVIDPRRVLAERGFPLGFEGEFEFAIADPLCEPSALRFVLHVREGRGRLLEGGRGSVRASIQAFASLTIGARSAAALAAEGDLVCGVDDARRLDSAFALAPGALQALP